MSYVLIVTVAILTGEMSFTVRLPFADLAACEKERVTVTEHVTAAIQKNHPGAGVSVESSCEASA